jgi:hypothetical protein
MNLANFGEIDQGRIKRRRGPHHARGPAVAHMWSRQCGILNISQLYRPSRPLTGIALLFTLLGRNSSSSGLEIQEYGRRDLLHWPRDTLYPQKLTLTSPITSARLVGIVRSQTKDMGVFICCFATLNRHFQKACLHLYNSNECHEMRYMSTFHTSHSAGCFAKES